MLTSTIEKDPFEPIAVMELLRTERRKSVSLREWKHRLCGYGYAIKQTARGAVIQHLSSRQEICKIPRELLH